MLDESIHSPVDAAKACKMDAADILNIKLMKCGGLYPAEKINAIAEANHVNCMVGCMLETKVAIAAGVSLVAAKEQYHRGRLRQLHVCSRSGDGNAGWLHHRGVAYIHCLRNRVLVWIWISNSDNKCSAGMR